MYVSAGIYVQVQIRTHACIDREINTERERERVFGRAFESSDTDACTFLRRTEDGTVTFMGDSDALISKGEMGNRRSHGKDRVGVSVVEVPFWCFCCLASLLVCPFYSLCACGILSLGRGSFEVRVP